MHTRKQNRMRSILFYSSFCSLLVHGVLFASVPAFPHPWVYYACVGTSLWNHGCYDNFVAKWTDRAMVSVCVGHNLFWVSSLNTHPMRIMGWMLTIKGVGFFLLSKRIETHQTLLHLISHVCATCSNVILGTAIFFGL